MDNKDQSYIIVSQEKLNKVQNLSGSYENLVIKQANPIKDYDVFGKDFYPAKKTMITKIKYA